MKPTAAKACAVNPLKLSRSLGAATAFLGLDACMPMMHAAQGCTSFGLTLLVRHFRERIPFQTSAMNEVTTILGGSDHLEQAILNIVAKTDPPPKAIGICSSGLIETRGEDIKGDLTLIRRRHPELADTALVYVSTPDYLGAFEDGWGAAVTAMVDSLVEASPLRDFGQVNILAGSQLTPADIEEIRDTVEAFGLDAVVLPDISNSLDGHVPGDFVGTTYGGTTIADIRKMGRSVATLAIGRQVEDAARLIEDRCGVPAEIFPRLTGLTVCDDFIAALMRLSGRPVPEGIKRRRSRLVDAMLDGHFFFGDKRIALAAEPDTLAALVPFLAEMGAKIGCAVTTTQSPVLETLPADVVLVGDYDDLERHAGACDLMIAGSQGRRTAERMNVPLYRVGMPIFDRLGIADRLSVGYRGTRALIFDIANIFLANGNHTKGASHATAAIG